MDIQKNGHQGTCTGHLCNQVEQGHEHGCQCSSHANRLLTQTEGQNVRHGEASNVTQRLSNEHQRNQPGDEEADRVQEAVVAVKSNCTDNTQEGCCRKVVTRNSETVLTAREGTATGIEVRRFGGGLTCAQHQPHGDNKEYQEHRNVKNRVTGRKFGLLGKNNRVHCA